MSLTPADDELPPLPRKTVSVVEKGFAALKITPVKACKMAPAASAVLHSPELLEAIILALPGEDILLAARVCTTWSDVVQTSPGMRNHLLSAKYKSPSADFTYSIFFLEGIHGTLVIRRHQSVEVIAMIKGSKVLIVDGRRASVKFKFLAVKVWEYTYNNYTTGQSYTGTIGAGMAHLGDYLQEYHDQAENYQKRVFQRWEVEKQDMESKRWRDLFDVGRLYQQAREQGLPSEYIEAGSRSWFW